MNKQLIMGIFSRMWERGRNAVQKESERKPDFGLAVGALKGLGSTLSTLGEIGSMPFNPVIKATGGNKVKIGDTEKALEKMGAKNALTPTTPLQKTGFVAEQVGEFFVPGGAVAKGAKGTQLAAGSSKVASLSSKAKIIGKGSKVLGEGISAGGVSLAQTGDVEEARNSALAGAVGVPLFSAAAKGVGWIGKEAIEMVSSALSGVPKGAIEHIIKNPDAVAPFIRKAADTPEAEKEVLEKAEDAFNLLKKARRDGYRANAQKLADETYTTKGGKLYVKKADELSPGKEIFVPTDLSLKGLKDTATKTLKDFGIGAKGKVLDFTKSALPRAYNKNLKEIVDRVYAWDDFSPQGIDDLREIVSNYREGGINPSSAAKKFNAIVDTMTSNVSGYVGGRVPQVAKMNSEYASQSKVLDKMYTEIFQGKDSGKLRRLMNAFNPKSTLHKELLQELGEKTGKDLLSDIAGVTVSRWTPEYLAKFFSSSMAGGATLGGVLNPKLLATLPVVAAMSSPKVVGKVAQTVGKVAPVVGKVADKLRIPAAIMAGKAARAPSRGQEQLQVQEEQKQVEVTDGLMERYPEKYHKFINGALEQGYTPEMVEAFLIRRLQEMGEMQAE